MLKGLYAFSWRFAEPIVDIVGVGLIRGRECKDGFVEPVFDHRRKDYTPLTMVRRAGELLRGAWVWTGAGARTTRLLNNVARFGVSEQMEGNGAHSRAPLRVAAKQCGVTMSLA